MEALLEATPETPSYMIGVRENKITRVPLMDAVKMVCFPCFIVDYHLLTDIDTDARGCASHFGEELPEGDVPS